MNLAKADTSCELHNILISVIANTKKSVVILGRILYLLKKDDAYKLAVGRGADTWEDYLRQPEISMAKGDANRLIQIYEEFILRFGLSEDDVAGVPTKNMYYLLPIVKKLPDDSAEEVEALVADAVNLSQQDFKERVYDIKRENGEVSETYEFFIMKKRLETNTMHRVPNITSAMIKSAFGLE